MHTLPDFIMNIPFDEFLKNRKPPHAEKAAKVFCI